MKLNVPMSARKSTSSWVPWKVRPSRRRALARLTRRAGDKKYGTAITLFVVMASVLTVNLIGGVFESASARDNYSRRSSSEWAYMRQQNQASNRTGSSQTTSRQSNSSPASTQPSQSTRTAKVTPTPTQAQQVEQQPIQPAQTKQPVVARVVQSQPAVEPEPVNTATDVATMTSAKAAEVPSVPVTYTSQQISDDTRDRLLAVSAAAVVVSALMYLLTTFGGGVKTASLAPIRYKIPVKEVISN